MDGAQVIARAIKSQGALIVFGVVGIPVIQIAEACTAEGLQFIAMRNEQSASYAAGALGYLTGTPGVCLVVSGPGIVHALAGLTNANQNCWPMILIGGASEQSQELMGAFQEFPQVEACRPYTKLSARPSSVHQIPFVIEKAFRTSSYGRPGPCYVDIPADFITGLVKSEVTFLPRYLDPPKSMADPSSIEKAVSWIKSSHKPMFIVGKGLGSAAYARAELVLKSLVESTNIPFLPTPMAKGVLSDLHPQCVAAARSLALKETDVVILVGARLNWMLHFGLPPRFSKDVKIIQIEVAAEETSNNVSASRSCPLVGDISLVIQQLNSSLRGFHFDSDSSWYIQLNDKCLKNKGINKELALANDVPMTYYRALTDIKNSLPLQDCFIVGEGANTMDIARTVIDQTLPRMRLDAGTFGTMGVGAGFSIAAQLAHPEKRVVCIQGDSAFGFSAMDLETAARYGLPILVIIINNNGIYSGLDSESFSSLDKTQLPSTALLPDAGYEIIASAFGGRGWIVKHWDGLRTAILDAWAYGEKHKTVCIVNVLVAPSSTRKSQEFSWLTRSDPKL